jgi:hypothetical protein
MAAYTGKQYGAVDAVQLDREEHFPSGLNGVKGDWLVRMSNGQKVICSEIDFNKMFSQVFPRPARETAPCKLDENRPVALPPITGGAA